MQKNWFTVSVVVASRQEVRRIFAPNCIFSKLFRSYFKIVWVLFFAFTGSYLSAVSGPIFFDEHQNHDFLVK